MKRKGSLDLSRREFLVASGIGMAGAKLTTAAPQQEEGAGETKIPIGVQLYSVRHECEKDLEGTLDQIARMGYLGVEFAGYYGRTAHQLRKLLDDRHLRCCGTHTGLDTLIGEELARTIEFNGILGNQFLICPWLPEERWNGYRALLETASLFNEIADKVKPAGMRVGYHNHNFEFNQMDDKTIWDVFFGNTRPEVVAQIDVGNAIEGGADALDFIRRYASRMATIHVKEYSVSNPKAYVGDGDVPWEEVFDILEDSGGIRWYIVEYEHEGVPPVEAIGACLENLRKLGKI